MPTNPVAPTTASFIGLEGLGVELSKVRRLNAIIQFI